mmetsp:Transcript_18987/g.60266  ORF Transcript_18987/g.60266 Transcript_18987/m.60266 type:complete len:210 (-) Transcript_18987:156-785(-)
MREVAVPELRAMLLREAVPLRHLLHPLLPRSPPLPKRISVQPLQERLQLAGRERPQSCLCPVARAREAAREGTGAALQQLAEVAGSLLEERAVALHLEEDEVGVDLPELLASLSKDHGLAAPLGQRGLQSVGLSRRPRCLTEHAEHALHPAKELARCCGLGMRGERKFQMQRGCRTGPQEVSRGRQRLRRGCCHGVGPKLFLEHGKGGG